MPHDPRAWDGYLPHPGIDYGPVAGTAVEVGAEADGQIVLVLRDGPALFVSFGRDEDPSAPATTVGITLDWTRILGPPAAGITPLVVAWTAGGGVLQLAPEEPDPLGTAPGARVLGGPEFGMSVPARAVPLWIDRLLRLPRRFTLDRRPEQLIWLGGLNGGGRLQLDRLHRTEERLVLAPAGTADAGELAPGSPLAGLAPALRSRWAGATHTQGPTGRLTAELFAIESERAAGGAERAPDLVVESLHRGGWTRDGSVRPPTWRQIGDGVTRWVTVHADPTGCPVPIEVPELAGACCWVERGELLAAPPVGSALAPPRRKLFGRR